MRPARPRLQRRGASLGLMAGLATWVSAGAQAQSAWPAELRFPANPDEADRRSDFALDLLRLALAASSVVTPLRLMPGYNQPRALAGLSQGDLDVAIVTAPVPPQGDWLPVRFPIRQGLLGLRLLVTTRRQLPRFEDIRTLSQLRERMVLGYGSDWRDLPQWRSLGFRVVTGSNYRGLFAMLAAGRFDYLSRGLNEVLAELSSPALHGNDLAVVPNLALRYPLDDYFVVRPGAQDLQQALQRGLGLALADGRYRRLFLQHFRPALEFARLPGRKVLPVTGYTGDPEVERAQQDLLQWIRTAAPAGRAAA